MSVAARVGLRASVAGLARSHLAARAGAVRYASTQASSRTPGTGRTASLTAILGTGLALGAYGYMHSPLRLESNSEQAKRKSYSERSKPKEQRGQVGGGPSGGTSGEKESSKREESEKKPEPINVTSYSGSTGGSGTDKSRGEKEQKHDDSRQSAADSNPLALDELEEEASQESAFDPETNTINWDCPCLGGMAHGPCGEQFKEAFSCFVFSEKEPKGIECVEKFKGMQECFRKYPEHYKEELEDDEEYESRDGETLEKMREGQLGSSKQDGEDDDEGMKEWRSELAKEGKN